MKQSEKKNGHYRAYIAANNDTPAFDFCDSETRQGAKAAVKRRNSPDWRDCVVWSVYIMPGGIEQCCKENH